MKSFKTALGFVVGVLLVSICSVDFLFSHSAVAADVDPAFEFVPDFSQGRSIPENGIANPYQLNDDQWATSVRAGKLHSLHYPVEITESLIPYQPIKNIFDGDSTASPFGFLSEILHELLGRVAQVHSMDDFYEKLGLSKFPEEDRSEKNIFDPYAIPFLNHETPRARMGVTFMSRYQSAENPNGAEGFTMSCATCHAGTLFGKPVMGLTTRFPKANEFFVMGSKLEKFSSPFLFRLFTGATHEETEMFKDTKLAVHSVGSRKPLAMGLDTSLAQVSLSLAKRNQDAYATKNPEFEKNPRTDTIAQIRSDSKPAVWWNVKYKNRFLSDGSLVSSNPIFTNFIWNEIGRGVDIEKLEQWLTQNSEVVRDLTTAVFASQPPVITDFFSVNTISLERAKHGETLFNQACAKCHGFYEKNWNSLQAASLSSTELLKTTKVIYRDKTPVINVGTDPGRYQGMVSLAQGLNPLAISIKNNIVIEPTQGYVPPPLVGIWARWPYFHNNSAPTLCAVLTESSKRPQQFYMGEAIDPRTDFDSECNGYPTGDQTPESWKNKTMLFDTRLEGTSNQGHDQKIFIKDGKEIFTPEDKKDLIQFLKTL
jgi:cytochrome c2